MNLPHLSSSNSQGGSQAQLQGMQSEPLGNPFQQHSMSSMDHQPMFDFLDAPNLMQTGAGSSALPAQAQGRGRPLVSNNSGVDLSSLRYKIKRHLLDFRV